MSSTATPKAIDAPITDPNDQRLSFFWLRLVYAGTIFLGLTTGPIMLFAPKLARKIVGFPEKLPEQDPLIFGIIGCFWTAAAILSIFGLKQPLKFVVIPMVQTIYKSMWLAFVFVPMWLSDDFPDYGWTLAVGNFLFLMLDLKAMPFRYLLTGDLSSHVVRSDRSGRREIPSMAEPASA